MEHPQTCLPRFRAEAPHQYASQPNLRISSVMQVGLHRGDGLFRGTEVRTMSRCRQMMKTASGEIPMDESSNRRRRNHVLRTLQDQCRVTEQGKIGAIVRQERNPGELFRDLRVGAAKTFLQFGS